VIVRGLRAGTGGVQGCDGIRKVVKFELTAAP